MSGRLDVVELIIKTMKDHEKELDRIERELKLDVEALTETVSKLLEEMRIFKNLTLQK